MTTPLEVLQLVLIEVESAAAKFMFKSEKNNEIKVTFITVFFIAERVSITF